MRVKFNRNVQLPISRLSKMLTQFLFVVFTSQKFSSLWYHVKWYFRAPDNSINALNFWIIFYFADILDLCVPDAANAYKIGCEAILSTINLVGRRTSVSMELSIATLLTVQCSFTFNHNVVLVSTSTLNYIIHYYYFYIYVYYFQLAF